MTPWPTLPEPRRFRPPRSCWIRRTVLLRGELVRLSHSIDDEPDRALAEIETLIGRGRGRAAALERMEGRDRRPPQRGEEPPVQRTRRVCPGDRRPDAGHDAGRRFLQSVVSGAGPSSWRIPPACARRLTRSRASGSNVLGANSEQADLILLVLDRSRAASARSTAN